MFLVDLSIYFQLMSMLIHIDIFGIIIRRSGVRVPDSPPNIKQKTNSTELVFCFSRLCSHGVASFGCTEEQVSCRAVWGRVLVLSKHARDETWWLKKKSAVDLHTDWEEGICRNALCVQNLPAFRTTRPRTCAAVTASCPELAVSISHLRLGTGAVRNGFGRRDGHSNGRTRTDKAAEPSVVTAMLTCRLSARPWMHQVTKCSQLLNNRW